MVQNAIYLENCKKLKRYGYQFVQTESGELASGAVGPGRLAEYATILFHVRKTLARQDLKGVRFLVTAGPTRERLDPVRFISNFSSGKMGFALAEEAAIRGADVTLISGPACPKEFPGIEQIQVESAAEMSDVVKREWQNNHVLLMSAAVADYRPKTPADHKIKKQRDALTLDLEATEDILLSVSKTKGDGIMIGFALETENGSANATDKLSKKNLDMICLNNPLDPHAGFETDTNKVTIIRSDGTDKPLPVMAKWQVSQHILDEVVTMLENRKIK